MTAVVLSQRDEVDGPMGGGELMFELEQREEKSENVSDVRNWERDREDRRI